MWETLSLASITKMEKALKTTPSPTIATDNLPLLPIQRQKVMENTPQ